MLITFEDNEDELIDSILSILNGFDKKIEIVSEKICTKMVFPGIEIDTQRRMVKHNNIEVKLTFLEFEILLLLARHPGIIFSKEQIYNYVWKEPYFGDYNIVMSHIRNIREKIEDDPSKPYYIQTVWGVGYCFNKCCQLNKK